MLQRLVQVKIHALSKDERLYADFSNHHVCDNSPTTIPQGIVPTSACPDLVIIREKEVLLLELMIPYNSPESLSNAHQRK